MRVELKFAVARVVQRAVVADNEKAVTADRKIEVVARGLDVALGELLGDLRTSTPLPAGSLPAPSWPEAYRSANSVREPLNPVVADVGKVVRDDRQVLVRGVDASERDV